MAFMDRHKAVLDETTDAKRIWTPTNGKEYLINSFYTPGNTGNANALTSKTVVRMGANYTTQAGVLSNNSIGMVIKGEGNTYPRIERGSSNNSTHDKPTVVRFLEVTSAQNYRTEYIYSSSNTFTPASGEEWAIKAWLVCNSHTSITALDSQDLGVEIGGKFIAGNWSNNLNLVENSANHFLRGFVLDDTMKLRSNFTHYYVTLQKVAG